MKTSEEFNEKYKDHLEGGFYGLEIEHEEVVKYLDKEFTEVVRENPDFFYSQIKTRFDRSRVYTSASLEKDGEWEKEIDKILGYA